MNHSTPHRMKGHILFFDFAFEEFLPVIEEAAARGFQPIMNQPAMRQVLAERGTKARGFEEFTVDGDADEAVQKANALGARFVSALGQPGAGNAFQSDRGNLLAAGGKDLITSIITMTQNPLLIMRVMERLIDSTDLKAVVMRATMSAGQRVVQAVAEQRGIPVLEIAHGNRCRSTDPTFMNVPWHLAVFGERQKELLCEFGSDPGRVHVTGAPQWDVLYDDELRLTKAEARERLGLPIDQQLILYAGRFSAGDNLYWADTSLVMMRANEMLAEALSRLDPGPSVAVRPHPGESKQAPGRRPTHSELNDYRRWFAQRGIRIAHIDFSDGSLVREKATLIQAADAVVTNYSTLPTEIMILRRPVVVLAPGQPLFPSFYEDQDGVVSAHDADQLFDALNRILGEAGYAESLVEAGQRALPELNLGGDGRAFARVVDVVEEVCAGAKAGARAA